MLNIKNLKAKLKDSKLIYVFLCVLLLWSIFSFDATKFRRPTSTVVLDKNGQLLGAKIATDGQWRFPHNDSIPAIFEKALIEFEDKHFYHHFGFNPVSIARAVKQNLKKGKIVSGGSTLSMQVMRLHRGKKKRTFFEKVKEILLAVRMELFLSKREILALYTSNAPFGGNVVGLDAASWRYFGREPSQLSIAEASTLAVLPNAPSLIYPGKNQQKLLLKRNRLIDKLYRNGTIDSLSCEIAKLEPLPNKPKNLPNKAPHFVEIIDKEEHGKLYKSTIDGQLQESVYEILNRHAIDLKSNEIHNAAILVIDISTLKSLVYIGNIESKNPDHASAVNIINAPRSTGSILKPFLYASMLTDGELLPNTLLPDVPTQISGYRPQNNSLHYDGAVPAYKALARSLNVPAVKMLQNYSVDKFHINLQKLNITTIKKHPSHYGLSLILGGAEATLWELVKSYAFMVDKLQNPARTTPLEDTEIPNIPFNLASIYLTLEAMNEVSRPDQEQNWEQFSSNSKIAWKTGTSYGNRDAWAIGVTPKYAVGVWVGNATGEGRPGISGIGAAAPILFDVFKILKPSKWFDKPFDDMEKVAVCKQSGYRATTICEPVDSMWIPLSGLKTKPCPYHQLVHLNSSQTNRVNSDCYETSKMITIPWFILPPSMEWYYKSKNPSYKVLPPYDPKCTNAGDIHSMELVYPNSFVNIYVPYELDGKLGETVFEAAHRVPKSSIYWHLDDQFIGNTETFHKMAFRPSEGKHTLTLVDQNGETIVQRFEIVGKKNKQE